MGTSADRGKEQDKDEVNTWYDDIQKLSEQACQHITEISDYWENVGPGPLVDNDVLERYVSGEVSISLDYDTFDNISGRIEELTSDIFKIHEKLKAIARV